MNPEEMFRQLMIERWQIALVISGGGTSAVTTFLRRPGASRNFVEVAIPYSRLAMADYLGEQPVGKSASIETARQLASRAHRRASQLSDRSNPLAVGLSLTAALPTEPPRDQQHQIHVVLTTDAKTQEWSHRLDSSLTSRTEAEDMAEAMLVQAIQCLASSEG